MKAALFAVGCMVLLGAARLAERHAQSRVYIYNEPQKHQDDSQAFEEVQNARVRIRDQSDSCRGKRQRRAPHEHGAAEITDRPNQLPRAFPIEADFGYPNTEREIDHRHDPDT